LIKNREKLEKSREKFYRNLDIDPRKKVLLFCASGWLSPNDEDFILMIIKAVKDKKISENIHIHIRMHPKYDSILNKVKDSEFVTIDRPFSYLKGNLNSWIFNKKDMVNWYNSIFHSAMVINVASTMSIDAAVLNRPVICLKFDGYKKISYAESISRYYKREHYANLVKTGGIILVENEKELIDTINYYLEDDTRNEEGRRKIIKQQAYKLDGQSSLRISNFLIKNLES
jgi:CDP-glycerol glycerophosphotransferase (TagB/SpsB family)